MMCYRTNGLGWPAGEASLGYGSGYLSVDNVQRRIYFGYPDGSGATSVNLRFFPSWWDAPRHEYGHWLLGGNNFHNYYLGLWSLMGWHQGTVSPMLNSYERERLGWLSFTPAGNDIVPLGDYMTQHVSVRMTIPNTNPQEYLLVENHHLQSSLDVVDLSGGAGVYVIHQRGEAVANNLKIVAADGRWNWLNPYWIHNPWGTDPLDSIPVYKRLDASRFLGLSYKDNIPHTKNGSSGIYAYLDPLTGQEMHRPLFKDDGNAGFTELTNNVFSPWSNPAVTTWPGTQTTLGFYIMSMAADIANIKFYTSGVDAAPPSKPQYLRFVVANGCATTIRWARNLEPDLVGYNIYRGILSGSGEPTYTKINSSLVTDTTYIDANYGSLAGLPRSTDLYHRYRVTAVDNQGKESVKSDYVDAFFTHIIDAQVANNWNMTSIPVVVCDFAATAVYPTATSPAYKYTPSGYVQTDTLNNKFGWWIKFGSQQTVTYAGTKIDSMAMPVSSGWNIIGSISVAVETCAVTSAPTGIRSSQFFKYQSGYVLTDKLYPGTGYWVKSSQNGHLILKKGAQCPPPSSPPPKDKFIVTDSEGNQQELYVVNAQVSPEAQNIEMPPTFAEAAFDVRWGSGDFETVVEPTGDPIELPIDLNEVSFPVTLQWELDPANGLEYVLDGGGLGKGVTSQLALAKTGQFHFSGGAHRIRLAAKGGLTEQLPTEFALHQNYPNPFNPVTTIRYQLPKDGFVVLAVFDILGREVATIAKGFEPAGYYSATFNAENLASGVYLVRFTVNNELGKAVFTKMTKMALLR